VDPGSPPPARRRWLEVAKRLVVVHFFGYLHALLWSVGAMPLAIAHFGLALETLSDADRADRILRFVAWPSGTAFLLAHAAVTPWLLSADAHRGFLRTMILLGALAGLGVLVAVGSWGWLLTR
jgi:hypothetical protein